ncbi:hypothetical protein CC1G_14641 [Coprinopsis cinerea okayama7|uniref:PUB domain-containing protein n=1 Tax=Coprinopsis cinerea (strain Okayama-7 / 130 / ATCC MYA-4618 / FGSC 9003) TaxID=240176 RepID=D6RMW9_COPC7|nr:hypothetical protein CC1G_14641 [Coprinopsis cinerea okayama7\|eukprot:XP_002911210.1 hypothetical protein CC1G_14641 [Coprinopsis cinerea okayama7\
MSSPSPQTSPIRTSDSPVAGPTPEEVAAAAERRFRQLQSQAQPSAAQLLQIHEKKQKFRRMVDPGIMRPNAKDAALSSLKVNPVYSPRMQWKCACADVCATPCLGLYDNPKFQRFKPTNTVIKRELVDRKGTLEYAVELGFRPEVENFQPYYKFNHRYEEDLKLGAEILKEFIKLYQEKDERAALAKRSEKAVAEAAHEKVRLAFMDDRKARMQRDEIERQARQARRSQSPAATNSVTSSRSRRSASRNLDALGEGRTLGETPQTLPDTDDTDPAPPPYAG